MILVTGGTGLLGSHLLFDLTNAGKKVRAIKRPNSDINNVYKTFRYYTKNPEELIQNIEWVNADLLDIQSLEQAIEGISYVYNCAGVVSFLKKDSTLLHDVNVTGIANLVNVCLDAKIKRFCHISSIAALGNPEDENKMIYENTAWNHSAKHSAYSLTKYLGEMEVWRAMAEGLNAFILNPSVILGPGDWRKSSALFFPLVWKGLRFYSNGVTGFVDVRDVSEVMMNLMCREDNNERYIINAENLSYKSFLSKIAESLGKKPPFIKASLFMLHIALIADFFAGKILFQKRQLSTSSIRTSCKKQYYTNRKIIDTLNVDFIPISDSVNHVAICFLKNYLK